MFVWSLVSFIRRFSGNMTFKENSTNQPKGWCDKC